MNGHAAASSSLSELKQSLKKATRAFLVRDYAAVDHFLKSLPTSRPAHAAWLDSAQSDSADVWRRVDILRINYLATIHTSPPEAIASESALSAETVLPTIWRELTGSDDLLPCHEAAFIHPAIVVTLVLAGMRLDQPEQAKLVAESWFGSVHESIDGQLAQTATNIDWNDVEWSVEGGMSTSTSIHLKEKKDTERELLKAWLKLHDALVLNVLPSLREWEQAEDFARSQAVENGGWVPDSRVNACIDRLKELQRDEELAASEVIERQKALDAQRQADKQREKEAAKANKQREKDSTTVKKRSQSPSSSSSSKRNVIKAEPQRQVSPPTSTPASSTSAAPTTRPARAVGTLEIMRQGVLSFFSGPSDGSATAPSVFAIPAWLRYQYSHDPLRLLGVVCFIMAFLSWTRRTLRNRPLMAGDRASQQSSGLSVGGALRLALQKVSETVKMGTRITTL